MSVLVEKVNEQEREAITSCVGCMKEYRWFVLHYYTPATMFVRLAVRLSVHLQTNPMSYDNLSCVS
jgi:ABC-type proline/glycine betaine transport system substrate-binding protein